MSAGPGLEDGVTQDTAQPGAVQDTVADAAATPQRDQPYAALGLTAPEYRRISGLLGRRPTDAELAIYSVMWSEHCSYKSSRRHLRQFADKAPPTDVLLAGIGAERRRRGYRPGLRGHLQDRVPQSPVLRRALPGRCHRRGRHRARHPGHGCPPGRGDGRAAVRARPTRPTPGGCCPASWAASPSTATASACPTSAASWPSTPAMRATRWSTRCAWACSGTMT